MADTEDVDGAATRPKERSNWVNDNAKDGEEAGDDAARPPFAYLTRVNRQDFLYKRKRKLLTAIAAPESSSVALACGRRGLSWRVLETNGEVTSAQRVSRH